MLEAPRPRELDQVAQLFKTASASVRAEMQAGAKRELDSTWKPGVESFASTAQQQKAVAAGSRAVVGADRFVLLAALGPALSGGLHPGTQWQGPEFGASPKVVDVRWRGKSRKQTIGKNFGPRRRDGKVAYKAAHKIAPRIVAAWVRGMVRGLARGNQNLETR